MINIATYFVDRLTTPRYTICIPPEHKEMTSEPPRVLLVDDDATILAVVSEFLEGSGLPTVRAATGADALARLAQGPLSAAVIDLGLPGMDGIELSRRIQLARPDLPVIILTGQGTLGTAIQGIQHGIFDFFEKATLNLDSLERSVRRGIERTQVLTQNRELLARLENSNRLLIALQAMTKTMAEESHLDRLLNLVVASARELCRADAARVVLLGRTHHDRFVIVTAAGDGADAVKGVRLTPEEGITTLVAGGGQPLVLAHPSAHPRYSARCDEMPTSRPGFIAAPLRLGGVSGVLTVAGREGEPLGAEECGLLAQLAWQAAAAIDNAVFHEQAANFFTHTSDMLVGFLERFDVFYPGHSRGGAALADMVTRRLGLSDGERRTVHYAALLHDIGKLKLDPALLSADRRLTEEELRLVKQHPLLGVEMLRPITLWQDILPIIHGHHERWDGRGYPAGLAGEHIPLGARIVAVADVFDAMTRNTPYGPRRTPAEALAELEAFAGTQFDPRVVRLFVAEYRRRAEQIPTS
jgi:putative nucleotidyltransferase with HDIG domain